MRKGTRYVWVDGKKVTPFEEYWGISAEELARMEQTTTEAIRMRVKKFGTPFQRRGKPSRAEILYGKTVWEISAETGLTHISVHKRIRKGESPFEKLSHGQIGSRRGGEEYKPVYASKDGWLMPQHPDYNTWRDNYEA